MSGYKFNHKKRGQAVIIVNQEYWGENPLEFREGADVDFKMMTDMFKNLDFYVSKNTRMNLTKDQMLKTIHKACNNKVRNKQSDCFVLVISTHGTEVKISSQKGLSSQATEFCHAVYASDSKLIYVDEILDMFEDKSNDDNGLKGKPKLFFIQACRSVEEHYNPLSKYFGYDPGHIVPEYDTPGRQDGGNDCQDSAGICKVKEEDTKIGTPIEKFTEDNMAEYKDIYAEDIDWQSDTEENEETKTDDVDRETDVESRVELGDKANDKGDAGGRSVSSYMPPVPIDIVTLNCPKDCLILYPVQPHKVALRNTMHGSYLLKFLSADTNINILYHDGLMKFLTEVLADVSRYEFKPHGEDGPSYKMAATVVHRLIDNVHFKEKEKQSRMASFISWLGKKLLKMRNTAE